MTIAEAIPADPAPPAAPFEQGGHAIIVGFGVPGRALADHLTKQHIPFVVIELNDLMVERCSKIGVTMVLGDVRDEATLLAAGIDRAGLIALTIPNEAGVLAAIEAIRRVNQTIRILARVTYVSSGFGAVKKGADDAVIAEELAAREFVRLVQGGRSAFRSKVDRAAENALVPRLPEPTPE